MSNLQHITSDTFETEVLAAGLPVLLEFGAVWCQPCRVLEPILEELAVEWDGKVKFAKLDADEASDIAAQYQVLGLPTTILFKGGQELERIVGMQPKGKIEAKIQAHVS